MRVALTGHYGFDGQEQLLLDLTELTWCPPLSRVILDIRGLRSLSAPGAAWLCATADRADAIGTLVGAETLKQFVGASRRDAAAVSIVRRFTDQESVRVIARDMADLLAARTGGGREVRLSLRILFDEIAENVIFHADAPFGGVFAVRHSRGTNEIEVGVADTGIGIRASLMRNPTLSGPLTDSEAARAALTPLVTGSPDRNGGFGLAVAHRLLDLNDGALVLRSGKACLDSSRFEHASVRVSVPGTIVGLRIRTDRPLDISTTYALLETHFDERLRQRGLHDDAPAG